MSGLLHAARLLRAGFLGGVVFSRYPRKHAKLFLDLWALILYFFYRYLQKRNLLLFHLCRCYRYEAGVPVTGSFHVEK